MRPFVGLTIRKVESDQALIKIIVHPVGSLKAMDIRQWLALSNVFGLAPFYYATGWGKVLLGANVLTSALMHISETKHELDPGKDWRLWSNDLLNLDRGFAYASTIYFGYKWYCGPQSQRALWYLGLGLPAMWLGELTTTRWLYGGLHTIWHLCAYGAIMETLK